MATGTVSKIVENGTTLVIDVNIGNAIYTATVSKPTFDALITNLEKQNYVISVLTLSRRTARQFENIYPALIGANITIPD